LKDKTELRKRIRCYPEDFTERKELVYKIFKLLKVNDVFQAPDMEEYCEKVVKFKVS